MAQFLRKFLLGFLWLLSLGIQRPSLHAEEGFRCKSGRIVSLGDRSYDVRTRCGDPDDKSERMERRRVGVRVRNALRPLAGDLEEHRYIDVKIEEWTYDSGKNRLIRVLSFEDGRLIQVATSKRGN